MTRPLTAEEAMEKARELGCSFCAQDGPRAPWLHDESYRYGWWGYTNSPRRGDGCWVGGGTAKFLGHGSPNPDGWRETKRRVKPRVHAAEHLEPPAAMKCGQHREQKEEA